jgi:hypothetical protein
MSKPITRTVALFLVSCLVQNSLAGAGPNASPFVRLSCLTPDVNQEALAPSAFFSYEARRYRKRLARNVTAAVFGMLTLATAGALRAQTVQVETKPPVVQVDADKETRQYLIELLSKMANEEDEAVKHHKHKVEAISELLRQMPQHLDVTRETPLNLPVAVIFDKNDPNVWLLKVNPDFVNQTRDPSLIPYGAEVYLKSNLYKEIGTLVPHKQFSLEKQYDDFLVTLMEKYAVGTRPHLVIPDEAYKDPRLQEIIFYRTAFWGGREGLGYLYQARYLQEQHFTQAKLSNLGEKAKYQTGPFVLRVAIKYVVYLLDNLPEEKDLVNSSEALWVAGVYHILGLWSHGSMDRSSFQHFYYGVQIEILSGRAKIENHQLVLKDHPDDFLTYLRDRKYTDPNPDRVAKNLNVTWPGGEQTAVVQALNVNEVAQIEGGIEPSFPNDEEIKPMADDLRKSGLNTPVDLHAYSMGVQENIRDMITLIHTFATMSNSQEAQRLKKYLDSVQTLQFVENRQGEGLVPIIKPLEHGFRFIFPPLVSSNTGNIALAVLGTFETHMRQGDTTSEHLDQEFNAFVTSLMASQEIKDTRVKRALANYTRPTHSTNQSYPDFDKRFGKGALRAAA